MRARAIVTLLLFGIAMTGCRGPLAGSKRVLRIADWGSVADDGEANRIIREIYAEFQRRHPDVDLQVENIPGAGEYVPKMLLSFVAHAEPDVMRLDASSAAVFINNGALRDLTPFCDRSPDFSIDAFFPNTVDVARRGDAVYQIPVDFTPLVVYYNRRLFDQSGVAYPKDGWTWAEFLSTAKQLTRGDRYGYTFTNWMAGWLPWLWNQPADVINKQGHSVGIADSPETVEAVTFLKDLISKEKVAPSLSQLAAEGAAPFDHADAAMETSGHWAMVDMAKSTNIKLDDVGVVSLPVAHSGQTPVTVIYESGWAIGKSCKEPDLAWEFITYYTSAQVQRKLQKTGIGVCARKDIAQERAVTDREREFLKIVPSGRAPWGATFEGYEAIEREGEKMMDAVLKSGHDPQDALQTFALKNERLLRSD